MKKKGFLLLRKLLVGIITTITVTALFAGLSPSAFSLGEFTSDFKNWFPYFFLGIFLYGVWASILSDSLARSMAYTTKKPEWILSFIIHFLAGTVLGAASLISAIVFFIIDRVVQRRWHAKFAK
ncbi:hypothetical protein [Alkalihalobacillus sp. CinArs1]|uniref:hypothetical protein n=1 Tax=Alkalihalobacillus sp. CinArs1 TaxID=2995314 RepID=UPI0022DD4442|nr:hypothetical protein [Alkalihalobacillus sp. CinArs1]